MKHELTNKIHLSHTDKLCLVALAGILITTTLIYELTDGQTIRAAEEGTKPVEPAVSQTIDYMPLVEAAETIREATEAAQADPYDESIPLSRELQTALREACEENDVPFYLALGVIHAESRFDPNADSGLSYGLMGLNRNYYPADLAPAENIRAGVKHLSGQIERYGGDIQAALRSYNLGHDDGDRRYAMAVLDASEKWGNG